MPSDRQELPKRKLENRNLTILSEKLKWISNTIGPNPVWSSDFNLTLLNKKSKQGIVKIKKTLSTSLFSLLL